MAKVKTNSVAAYVIVIAFGAMGGFSFWYWGSPNEEIIRLTTSARKPAIREYDPEAVKQVDQAAGEGLLAQRYAESVRDGDCGRVIGMTLWMQDRLSRERALMPGAQREEEVSAALCESIQERSPEGNQFSDEGIDDKYIFGPGAAFVILGVDAGRDDLEATVRERVWIEVTYPGPVQAPKDHFGNPVRSMIVGVNISENGDVLKAGVRGNVDIDLSSFSYNWPHEGE